MIGKVFLGLIIAALIVLAVIIFSILIAVAIWSIYGPINDSASAIWMVCLFVGVCGLAIFIGILIMF